MSTTPSRAAPLTPDLARRIGVVERAMRERRVADADREITLALATHPDHPALLRLYGAIRLEMRDHRAAIDALERARQQVPADTTLDRLLALACEGVFDYAGAEAALRRVLANDPANAPSWSALGQLLFKLFRIDEADAALRRAVEADPREANATTMLANIRRAEGRGDDALARYRQAIALQPGNGMAWWGLTTVVDGPLADADVASMRRAWAAQQGSLAQHVALGFALAQALERRGEFGAAFAQLGETHALARRLEPWNATAFSAQLTQALQGDAAAPVEDNGLGGEVIFITSLPRSGSTLAEQILGSHRDVQATAELPTLVQIISETSQALGQPFERWLTRLPAAQWRELGERYLERTAVWRRERPRSTDKMPGNWFFISAIRRMLPRAHIVLARRDPLETCLACYRFAFSGHAYTHTFADLAAQWRDFDRAAAHWRERDTARVHELVYEALQAEPDAQIRALLDACGLDFDPACLDFHQTRRLVMTPSAVREPLRRDTARAPRYGALLDPLRAALGMPPFQP